MNTKFENSAASFDLEVSHEMTASEIDAVSGGAGSSSIVYGDTPQQRREQQLGGNAN
jgi:hypothetical protein